MITRLVRVRVRVENHHPFPPRQYFSVWSCRLTHIEVHCTVIECSRWEVKSTKLLTVLRGREEGWCRISEQCRHNGSKVGIPGTIQFGLLCTTIENVRKGFTLCIRSPLVGADALSDQCAPCQAAHLPHTGRVCWLQWLTRSVWSCSLQCLLTCKGELQFYQELYAPVDTSNTNSSMSEFEKAVTRTCEVVHLQDTTHGSTGTIS